MAITDVSICNSAVIKLGGDRISSLSSDTFKSAVLCNEQYPKMRDELLSKYMWKFARRRASLAQTTAPAFGFIYAYALPADYLAFPELDDNNDAPFQIEGKTLLTDESTVKLLYSAQVIDTSYYTPLFAEALAARIALEISYALTGNATVQSNMASWFDNQISYARTMDSFQGTTKNTNATEWINSRF